MNATVTDLRAALQHLAAQAPAPHELDSRPWQASAADRVPAHRHRVRVGPALAATLSAIAVLGVAGLVATLTASSGERTHHAAPGAAASAGLLSEQVYGPSSLPGFELDTATLGRRLQSYTYDTPHAPYTTRTYNVIVFVPDSRQRDRIRHMAAVHVDKVTGAFSTTPVTGNGLLSTFYAPTPPAKYQGTTVPDVSVLTWPIDDHRWTLITPVYAGGVSQVVSRDELISRAASLTPARDDQVSPVRVGYIPPGLQLASVTMRPVITSTDQGANSRPGPAGLSGTAQRLLTFTRDISALIPDTGTAPLAIEVLDGVARSLDAATPDQLPQLYGGHWRSTRINGHHAWVSAQDVLITWGDLVIGISTSNRAGSTAGLLPKSGLLKVAASIQAPVTAPAPGHPLTNALPASALH